MHEAYIRIVPGAETALLCIHGIIGTPRHFDLLLSCLPDGISVMNLLLDGHGQGVKEFSNTSMKKWESQVAEAVKTLSQTHRRIYILAHSMGTLLAIEQAVKNPSIQKLFLLAVPLSIHITAAMLKNLWNVYRDRLDPEDPVDQASRTCCGITQSKNLLHYLGWIPRYLELFKKISDTRKLLPSLHTSCIAFQSAKDELVSTRSINLLKEHSSAIIRVLENSGHYYYDPADFSLLTHAFQDFIKE